ARDRDSCRRDRERHSKGRAAVLCWSWIERADGSFGCGRMSADVWDFVANGSGADRRRAARDYPCGGRGGGFNAERGARFARKEANAERRGGGNRGERDDALRPGRPN